MPQVHPLPMREDWLFVYGTLRQGGSNDMARLVPQAALACQARLRGRLFDLGAYPTLLVDEQGPWVHGEVYRVPASGWPALDALEEVVTPARPHGHYFRVAASVDCADGEVRACQVYVANPAAQSLERPIESGDWIAWHGTRRRARS